MSDRYWGKIEFPAALIDAEITEVLEAEGVEMDNLDPSDNSRDDSAWVEDGIFTLEDSQARYGQFEELEDLLVLKKIPFDRESGALYEFIPEMRVFRPNMDRDMTFLLCDGSVALDLEVVRAQLRLGAFALQAYLNEKFPEYPPLADFVTEGNTAQEA